MLQMICSELIHDNFSETTPSKFHTVMSSCFAMIIINEQSLLANLVDIFYLVNTWCLLKMFIFMSEVL